jgi:hypothetical protein
MDWERTSPRSAAHCPTPRSRDDDKVVQFAPRPIPQPSTENQRNPFVSCARDMYGSLRGASRSWHIGFRESVPENKIVPESHNRGVLRESKSHHLFPQPARGSGPSFPPLSWLTGDPALIRRRAELSHHRRR